MTRKAAQHRPVSRDHVGSREVSDWFEHFGFGEVADNLVIGAYPQDAEDVAALKDDGITRIFNLVQDVEYDEGSRDACVAALTGAGIEEQRLELVDYGGLLPGQIELAVRAATKWLDEGERVYVHCRAGWQRSATVAAAIVSVREGVEPEQALELIKSRKATASPLPHQRQDLFRWWAKRSRVK
jgi:protein-tyrosine phosphatase